MIDWFKKNCLLSLLLVVGIGFFIYYIVQAVRWIPYPNSLDYGEPFVMNYSKLWANSQWKWDVNVPPYLTMVYGIGFQILSYPFVKLFGAELWVGRLLSFLSALVVCGILYLIVKDLTGRKSYGLLAALLPATQPIFRDWSMMARVDMPAVMFDVVGFYLVMKLKDTRYVYIAVIPFICAMMIKLTAIAGLGAVVIYLIIYNRKKLLIFLFSFVLLLIVCLIPLMVTSGGTYLKHIITYNNTIENIYLGVFLFLLNGFVYPFILLGVLSVAYIRKCFKGGEWTLPCLFFIIALSIDLFATLRPGAASMYYFEAIISSCICASLAMFYLMNSGKKTFNMANSAFIGLLIVIFAMYTPKTNFIFPNNQYTQDTETVKAIIIDSNKPLITENPSLALTMGKNLYIEFFIFTNMSRLGYWDDTAYINKYNEQYFDYVVLRVALDSRIKDMGKGVLDGDFTNIALKTIDANYSLVYQTKNPYPYSMYVYEAKGKLVNDARWAK